MNEPKFKVGDVVRKGSNTVWATVEAICISNREFPTSLVVWFDPMGDRHRGEISNADWEVVAFKTGDKVRIKNTIGPEMLVMVSGITCDDYGFGGHYTRVLWLTDNGQPFDRLLPTSALESANV